jgi:mono/diheme cytochrome c family protein
MTVSISRSRWRRNWRKCILGIAAALVAAGTAAPLMADEASSKNIVMSKGWEFTEQGGAEVFKNVCAACHQPDAEGAIGAAAYPPLAANKKLQSTEFVLAVLFAGLRGMPPVASMMSDEQVADVINYVRTHFGNGYADAISAGDVAAARQRALANP